MKKTICLAVIFLLIISCNNKEGEEARDINYYPTQNFFDDPTLKQVEVEFNDDFIGIVNSAIRLHQNDSIPYIELEEGKRIVKIIVMRSDGGMIARRNFIIMTKDSVSTVTRDHHLTQLEHVLRLQYENNGQDLNLASRAELVVVEIVLDPYDTGQNLIESLKILLNNFDKVNESHNDSLQLNLAINVPLQIPPFPPPPVKN